MSSGSTVKRRVLWEEIEPTLQEVYEHRFLFYNTQEICDQWIDVDEWMHKQFGPSALDHISAWPDYLIHTNRPWVMFQGWMYSHEPKMLILTKLRWC